MWLIKVLQVECCRNGKDGQDYGNIIPVSVNFIKVTLWKSQFFQTQNTKDINFQEK